MNIIPAIDIYGGRCVRLYQGDYTSVENYQKDPITVARQFEEAGATRMHIVDLDAARGNKQINRKIIRKMRRAVSATIQIGGGIRSDYDIEELVDIGIEYLVIGTAFVRTPHLLEGWISHYGNIFIAGIDARDGKAYVEGWEQKTKVDSIELAVKASVFGAEAIVYTNIAHDGTLQGPDIAGTLQIAQAVDIPVILSGGISCEEDIQQLVEEGEDKISGIILGKSIYEGAIDLKNVISRYNKNPTGT